MKLRLDVDGKTLRCSADLFARGAGDVFATPAEVLFGELAHLAVDGYGDGNIGLLRRVGRAGAFAWVTGLLKTTGRGALGSQGRTTGTSPFLSPFAWER